ncbi:hypothetical protein B9Q01_01920 [Candidatus Marsarchaeota G1 archaeon OSP_D]|uniref:Uncharacterized protein n=3 Tax=Candidatus Marsarchaeota group 1 TaxID=2203770 RepID=A0A2R6AJG5_9ARCH|nr:MAG: hypothetical protein B9Q01_01920 [Candidatus Marsarchaeota G1 archaeon OSP_D]PSN86524.1 MAG: hypothetical protein B9Q02_02100 [Candidatus Marsarchaeota G1 archaeon BE_D]PSN89218.1 MAG: hypothetical protein B9Q00_02385 [Candidatus Marsarchaeota G1 archaeon OSP_C]
MVQANTKCSVSSFSLLREWFLLSTSRRGFGFFMREKLAFFLRFGRSVVYQLYNQVHQACGAFFGSITL